MSADSADAVWRDPMNYDPVRDGPPYLPVTASQRQEARDYIGKNAAYYDVPKPASPYDALSQLLVGLRMLAMAHQTAHWQARGSTYYGDHLLFERLYTESTPFVDAVAERLIGLTGDPGKVSLCDQIASMYALTKVWEKVHGGAKAPPPSDLVDIALKGELLLTKGVAFLKKEIQAAGALTEGLDDLLQAIASKHEEFVYLLRQRSDKTVYSYDRSDYR